MMFAVILLLAVFNSVKVRCRINRVQIFEQAQINPGGAVLRITARGQHYNVFKNLIPLLAKNVW